MLHDAARLGDDPALRVAKAAQRSKPRHHQSTDDMLALPQVRVGARDQRTGARSAPGALGHDTPPAPSKPAAANGAMCTVAPGPGDLDAAGLLVAMLFAGLMRSRRPDAA